MLSSRGPDHVGKVMSAAKAPQCISSGPAGLPSNGEAVHLLGDSEATVSECSQDTAEAGNDEDADNLWKLAQGEITQGKMDRSAASCNGALKSASKRQNDGSAVKQENPDEGQLWRSAQAEVDRREASGSRAGKQDSAAEEQVQCPICLMQWPADAMSNAELNSHVDSCLLQIS